MTYKGTCLPEKLTANGWLLRFNEWRTASERLQFIEPPSHLTHKFSAICSQTWKTFDQWSKYEWTFHFFRSEVCVKTSWCDMKWCDTITSFKSFPPFLSPWFPVIAFLGSTRSSCQEESTEGGSGGLCLPGKWNWVTQKCACRRKQVRELTEKNQWLFYLYSWFAAHLF